MQPEKLDRKLNDRKENSAFRQLPISIGTELVDFSSNDYLGLAKSEEVFGKAHQLLEEKGIKINGATGSRLLSGNHQLYSEVEQMLCAYHQAEASLIFNSGYNANTGFFSSVPQRGDIVLYDELIHASIRDGIKMSNAKSYKFKHNDLNDLKCHAERSRSAGEEIYVVTESVFSMDGDIPDLKALVDFCSKNNCHFVVDEAHAVGVFGEGLLKQLGLENKVFARIITFGKALGCHGAAILGSNSLKDYLINFARSFIYTTALPPHSLATIMAAYDQLNVSPDPDGYRESVSQTADVSRPDSVQELNKNITFFNRQLEISDLKPLFIPSNSAIHCCVISGNEKVKDIAAKLHENGFDVKPILSPTVAEGRERLRFCLHSFNTQQQIATLVKLLVNFVKK